MRISKLACRIGAALALLSPSELTGAQAARIPNVGVLVQNLSTTPLEVVQEAEAACQQIYRAAGILVTWNNGAENVRWIGPDVVLRAVILPHAPPSRALAAFGTALRDRQVILVYHDRVVRFAEITNLNLQSMLSLALVHEIGHLLLDTDEHTPSGIMRGEWGRDDLNAISGDRSQFTADQIRRMKGNVEKRGSARAR